jgi:hypothetical protein
MIGIKPPPLWTSMNAIRNYEKHMTHADEIFTFNFDETRKLLAAKEHIEKVLPSWIRQNPNIVVAGGCWASSLHDRNYKDVDIFILDCSNIEKEGIRDLMKAWDCEDKTEDYARNNDKIDAVWSSRRNKFQFIFTKHKTRKELIEDFDYVHCKASYNEGKLYITRKIYDAIENRHLIVQNNKNIQEWRKKKFLDRGYKEAVEMEPTLGDILAGALKRNPVNASVGSGGGGGSTVLIQTEYIPW